MRWARARAREQGPARGHRDVGRVGTATADGSSGAEGEKGRDDGGRICDGGRSAGWNRGTEKEFVATMESPWTSATRVRGVDGREGGDWGSECDGCDGTG